MPATSIHCLASNPTLVTALNTQIVYEKAVAIAKRVANARHCV